MKKFGRVYRTLALATLLVAVSVGTAAAQQKDIQREWTPILNKLKESAVKDSATGDRYIGQQYNGARHGVGLYYGEDGSCYFGEWSNGTFNGTGTYLIQDGSTINNCGVVYVGNWSNGKKSGKGRCYDKSGNLVHFGEFSNDKLTGIYPVTGNYSGRKFQVLDMRDAGKYIGETKDGQLVGFGTYLWKNGDMCYSTWKNGNMNGKGIYSWYNETWQVMNCSGSVCKNVSSFDEAVVGSNGNENAVSVGTAAAQAESFTDSRDDQTYKTVKIGRQTWMAQNLNYKIGGSLNSWCYKNSADSCEKYGRLYNWDAAKSACPTGWKLPTSQDWDKLAATAGGLNVAGKKLKSKSGWNNDGNGTDDYGFSALPGGFYFFEADFDEAGNIGFWWSATENVGTYPSTKSMRQDADGMSGNNLLRALGLSVRCLQETRK